MIHFSYGPNAYAIAQERQRLIAAFAQKNGDAHGVERVEAEDVTVNTLRELLQATSLFTSSRLVVLLRPSANKQIWEALPELLDSVPEGVDVVVVEPAPDKRTRTFKQLNGMAEVFEAKELDESSAIQWLINTAKSYGKRLDRKDADLLVTRVGLDQSRLAQELNKLVQHDEIDEELILSLTEAVPHVTVFELLDAVLAKRTSKARELLNDLKGVEDPYKTFGLISSQVHALVLVVAAKQTGVNSKQVAIDSGMHPFVISKTERVAAGTSWAEAMQIVQTLAGLDDRLKRSGADPWDLLEAALLQIAARP